ncbi:hypothetical protein PQ459_12635 [Chryseobacterium sp. KACC 21268]|nr:hypothetical protein PQ459_12635 [Chryseobacterium sp. KACC 21268]
MIKENKKLKALTLEELKMKQKRFTNFVSFLSILTMLTLAILIYLSIKSNNYTFLMLCGGSSFALLLCGLILRQVEAEITARNSHS